MSSSMYLFLLWFFELSNLNLYQIILIFVISCKKYNIIYVEKLGDVDSFIIIPGRREGWIFK